MSATKSSTTASSSTGCADWARCSSTSSTRCRTTGRWSFRPMACRSRSRPRPRTAASTYVDATCPLVSKVHRQAAAADRGRAPHPVHRSCRPSRGDRHVRPGARRVDDPDRDGRRRRGPRSAGHEQSRLPDADDPVGRRHGGDRRRAEAPLPERSARRAAKTFATRPRTARRRSRRSPASATGCW